jgi:hypothetical protein
MRCWHREASHTGDGVGGDDDGKELVMTKDLKAELAATRQRLDALEAVTRYALRVQKDSLAKAERLRELGLALIRHKHCSEITRHVRGREEPYAVIICESKPYREFVRYIRTLESFHKPNKRYDALMEKLAGPVGRRK